jgi:hypothetical protein|tara:strand:- start:655 stop:1023 length:369 start_codon:yes stop_codon:yes gene_type:complete
MGPEAKFYKYFKKNTPNISYTRIENTASLGCPDVLAYNKNNVFFTIEFKVTKRNSVRFSPHQIAFHVKHPINSFILVQTPEACGLKLYEGRRIRELVACGLELDAWGLGLDACRSRLELLGA